MWAKHELCSCSPHPIRPPPPLCILHPSSSPSGPPFSLFYRRTKSKASPSASATRSCLLRQHDTPIAPATECHPNLHTRAHGGRETAGPKEAPRGTGPAPIRLHRRGAGRPQGPRRPPEVTRGTDPAPIRLHRRGAGGPKGKIRLRDEKTRPKPPYTKAKSSKKDPKSLWRGVKTSGR